MRQLSYLVILLILVVVPVYGAQIQLNSDNGLDIRYPQIDVVKLKRSIDLHFHVYNREDSVALHLGDLLNCSLHLYNETGIHIWTGVNDVFTDYYDIVFHIDGGNFTREVTYSYIAYCECPSCSATEGELGGFVSVPLRVTRDGEPNQNTSPSSVAIVLFLMFVTGIMFFLPIIKPDVAGSENIREDANKYAAEIVNLIYRRGVWTVTIYLTTLNFAIIANLAAESALPVWSELFRYIWIFGTIGYISMGFLVFTTLVSVLRLWNKNIKMKRTGWDGE